MANKRQIKKSLKFIMNDLFTATIIASVQKDAKADKVEEAQEKILKTYSDFNSRLSNYERRNAKAFFKQFKTEINAELENIIKNIEEI